MVIPILRPSRWNASSGEIKITSQQPLYVNQQLQLVYSASPTLRGAGPQEPCDAHREPVGSSV